MKKLFCAGLSLMCGLTLLTGCKRIPDLPDDPIVFKTGEYVAAYAVNEEIKVSSIENGDKTYLTFGVINAKKGGDYTYAFGDCLGYVDDDKSTRIYALEGESPDEWLIEYYVDGEMENPVVLKAVGAKSSTPDSVNPLE